MEKLLENQVAIITGSGRGIGAAAAKLFAESGAKVVVNDLDREPAESMAAEIQNAGGQAIAVPGDVLETQFPEKLMRSAVDAYGKINILVNNAGFTWDGMLHKMSDEQWEAVLAVHTTAPFRMIRAAAAYLREPAKAEKKAGGPLEPRCIVNVSSTSGLHGNIGQANYATGKLGIIGLTKTIAKEWGAFGIRCNAVAFGFIDTRMTAPKESGTTINVGDQEVVIGIPQHLRQIIPQMIPLGRAGTPNEAAAGILFLASPLAAYVTGHVLEVTGGAGI
jgi:3-oxoacyl-[acyl-carrier protein] reductase